MRIPNQIKLGGHTIAVEINSDRDSASDMGSYHNFYNVIRLNDTLPEDNQAETFLHEILEVIKGKFNLDTKHSDLVIFSEMLFHVLRTNNLNFTAKDLKDE